MVLIDSKVYDFEDGLVAHEGLVDTLFLGALLAVDHNIFTDLCVSKGSEGVHEVAKPLPSSVETLEMLMVVLD